MNDATQPALVLSHLWLRRCIGVLGASLPIVLPVGLVVLAAAGIAEASRPGSLSAYYHTGMGNVFVGVLCAVGVFLFSYLGYGRGEGWASNDNIWANLAGLGAVGTALFPTAAADASPVQVAIGRVHGASAALFLFCLAYMSLRLFTRTGQGGQRTPRKRSRDRVYKVCGWTILGALALMGLYLLDGAYGPFGGGLQALLDRLLSDRPIFWLEAVAVFAFGISWFTKGEALLGDT